MLKNSLLEIKTRVTNFSENKEDIYKDGVKTKLNNVAMYYHKTLEDAYDYLMTRSPLKVLKTIARQNSEGEHDND